MDLGTQYDVAIVGGGPSGSTAAALLRKYNLDLSVLIIEKEVFPREHVGESQLPSVGPILHEMGVWDEVEAAGFPIKIGASYTWGKDLERWDFDFIPLEEWTDQQRPARFEGLRQFTAFQVERAKYDDILLRHAASLGAEVQQGVRVEQVAADVGSDTITSLTLDNGEVITATHYIDCTGTVGLLRRAVGVESQSPKELRNIAIWDYWDNAEWAVEIGVGGTRVQVRSLPYGWMWFIPLGPTRTSIGLIVPSEYYQECGKSIEELYHQSIARQADISALTEHATCRNELRSCKDWSHLADRLVGENWFLCGESAGFADPILAAGMSLAHSSAREAAYTILALERGEHDAAWLRERYNERNRRNIEQHIRFAQFWYSANRCFTDLQEHCSDIAREAGLRLAPQQAWRWLSQGGFTTEASGIPTSGSFDVASAKQILELFDGKRECGWMTNGYNVFALNLHGAEEGRMGVLRDGRIETVECYYKGGKTLPQLGYYGTMIEVLQRTTDAAEIYEFLKSNVTSTVGAEQVNQVLTRFFQALEVMVQDGWVHRSRDKKRPMLNITHEGTRFIRPAIKTTEALERAGKSDIIKSRID